MSTIINLNWDSNEQKLFMGDSLGVADYVNIKYPRLEELALTARAQFWVETEQPLDADKKQWPNLPEYIRKKTLLNLAWQVLADSIITRAPENALNALVSRPELEGMLQQWSYFEGIHSRAYSNIIRIVLPNPAEYIDTVQKNEEAFARLALPVSILDEMAAMSKHWVEWKSEIDSNKELGFDNKATQGDEAEFEKFTKKCEEKLLETYYAIYGLEALMFYASFACTFGLAEQDILPGIAGNLQLIAKDEALHTVMAMEVINILSAQLSPEAVARAKANAPKTLRAILQTEINWAYFIFPEGEDIPGLNAELLVEYLYYNARLAFLAIGIEWPEDLPVITSNPIIWINKYLNPKNEQVAPQERQLTSYQVASMTQSSDEELSDLGKEFGEFL